MANSLIPGATGANLAERMSNVQRPQTSNAGGRFCQFNGKTGDYLVGTEQEDINGDTVVVITDLLAHGWLGFAGAGVRPLKIFSPIDAPMPEMPERDRPDRDFQEARQLAFVPLAQIEETQEAEDDAVETIRLEGSSVGMRQGIDDLIGSILTQAQINPEKLYPIVDLDARNYVHAQHGTRIFNPVFTLRGWTNANMETEWLGEETKKLESKPAKKSKPAADKAPQGARRRRRTTAS